MRSPRLLNMLEPRRLQVAAYTLAAVYAAVFFLMYKTGNWLFDSAGRPFMNDFTYFWIEGTQALHGNVAALYDPAHLTNIVAAVVGPDHATPKSFFYPNSPNPPILFLVLAPLAMLSYVPAVFTWEAASLLGCVAVVYLIVRDRAAIAVALASPFGAWDFYWGQTGFLRTALLGAALLALERRPLVAGVFIGCLTYKPQFGIMLPVALVAAGQWRAVVSAAMTALVLVGVSLAAFGSGPWAAFPRALRRQADLILLHNIPGASVCAADQTIYGLVRILHGSAAFAWLAQGCVTAGIAVIVWLVWRSSARYALKAALLSAATLIATPYAWAHDLTAIAIPIAFLAADQMEFGLLTGEQTILVSLFGLALAILLCAGGLPLGPVIMIALAGLILRRVFVMAGAERLASSLDA